MDKLKSLEDLRKIGLDNMPGFILNRTSCALKKFNFMKLRKVGVEFNAPEEFAILVRVFEKPGLTQGEYSELTFKDKTTVTRHIKSLESKGLIKRQQDEEDKRQWRVTVSASGEKTLRVFFKNVLHTSSKMAERVSKKDMQTTIKTLKVMQEVIYELLEAEEQQAQK
jgi:DNA-binding MarR family transcriptional regulator